MVGTGMGGDNELEVVFRGDANDLNQAVDGARSRLVTLQKVAGIASAALAGLGVLGFAKAAQEAAAFEEQMVEVEKVTNPQTAQEMGHAIRDMAETIPLAHEELAQITADAGRFGLEGSESIQEFTETVSRMSVATNLSANEAGEAMARLSELTDTPTEQMENLGSVINILSNNAATSSDEIVDSMLRSSAALSQLGLSAEEIAAVGTALNEVSESSQRAGTRLRRVGQQLMDPSTVENLSSAFGMTQEEFRNMRDEAPLDLMMQLASAMREGGDAADVLRSSLATPTRQALAGLAQNLDGTTEALAMANHEFENAESLQKEFDAATETLSAQTILLKNRLRETAQVTGDSMMPALRDVVSLSRSAVDGFNNLNEATNGLAGQLTLLSTVAVGTAGAIRLLGLGAGTPIGAAILAIGALGIAYTQNMAGIRDITHRTASEIDESWQTAMQNMSDNTSESLESNTSIWQEFRIRVAEGLDSMANRLTDLLDLIITFGTSWVDTAQSSIEAFGQMQDVFTGDATVDEALDTLSDSGEELFEEWEQIRQRAAERDAALQERRAQRAQALQSGDMSLMPSNQGEDDGPAWQQGGSPQDQQQSWEDMMGEFEERREDWRDNMEDMMGDSMEANQETADALQGSPLSDEQSLRDGLLDPFERAQPDCFEVTEMSAENQVIEQEQGGVTNRHDVATGPGTSDTDQFSADTDSQSGGSGSNQSTETTVEVDGETLVEIVEEQMQKHQRTVVVTE